MGSEAGSPTIFLVASSTSARGLSPSKTNVPMTTLQTDCAGAQWLVRRTGSCVAVVRVSRRFVCRSGQCAAPVRVPQWFVCHSG